MKKAAVFLLASALAFAAAGCGGDDGDDSPTGPGGPFNFNGKWAYEGKVVSSNVPTASVGDKIIDTATLTASGTRFTMDFPGPIPPYVGTCDPVAGTFQGKVVYQGMTMVVEGHSTDSESLAGTETWTSQGGHIVISWKMSLVSRHAGMAGATSWEALVEAFGKGAH